jgi:TonB family protein
MPTFARAACVVLAVYLTCITSALAQDVSAPTAPVPVGSTDVPYPPGAEGSASVVLELLVEKDGSVSRVTVVDGSEPFAEHARQAVLAWRFAPAQRAGVAVAARIRARVVFEREKAANPSAAALPPPTSASVPVPTSSGEPSHAAPVASEAPVEITVSGYRREVGQTTLSAEEVRALPGAFGDAFRAIEVLPGVTPLVSGIPYFYVRGAPPNNSGYYVDGVKVPLLFHLGIGQGVIHSGLIERLDFFPSAAPARYGGSAGGIMVGQTREPASAFHGEANLRLIDAGALLESPFADGRGSALVAGRYGYPGPILEAVSPDIGLGYWDYQARATWQLTARDTLSLFAFGSHDYLATRSDASSSCGPNCPSSEGPEARGLKEEFVSDFHRLDLRYDHLTKGGRLRVAATGGYDSQGAPPTYLTDHSAALRVEFDQQLSEMVRVRAGAEGRFDRYRLRLTASGPGEPEVPASANPPPTNLYSSAHADAVLRLAPRVELVPGARVEVFGSSRDREAPSTGRTKTVVPAISPRLSSRITLSQGLAWLSNFGLSHQYPSLRVGNIPAPMLSVPGFPFGVRRLQTAAQASSGFELGLPAEITAIATGFYTRFSGLTDLTVSCFQDEPGVMGPMGPGQPVPPPYVCPNNQPVSGRAYGLELLVRTPVSKRVSGWLSYTLSRATREAHFLSRAGGDTVETVPSEFDRTHVFNASLSYDLGRRWRVGGRFLFYTGTPYSALDGAWPVPPYNAYRNPAFFRVDFRLEKRWRLGQTGSIAWVLEGQNVTLSKEVTGLGLDCESMGSPQGGTTTCEQSKVGPITIPSVGLEAYF